MNHRFLTLMRLLSKQNIFQIFNNFHSLSSHFFLHTLSYNVVRFVLLEFEHIILFHAILWVHFLFISHIFHLYLKPWFPYLKNDIITKATYPLSVRASCSVFFYSASYPWRRQGSFNDWCFSLYFPGPYILLLSLSILFQFSISVTQMTT